MKKTRILALLLALLLLALPLLSCSDKPETPPEAPLPSTPQSPTPEGDGPADDGEPNTDPDYDPTKDPELFLSNNGYPMELKVVFTKDGYGFDTAAGTILNGSNSLRYTFAGDDLRDLYRIFDNCNLWTLPTALTYSQLTGNSAGESVLLYTLTVSTVDREARTYYIDSAAISRLSSDPNVANLSAAVTELEALTAMYAEKAGN